QTVGIEDARQACERPAPSASQRGPIMTDAERDPVLRRALEELRKVPPANVDAMRRVVAAAAAARVTPFDGEPGILSPRRGRSIRLWMVVGVAAASAFVGFTLRGAWTARARAA